MLSICNQFNMQMNICPSGRQFIHSVDFWIYYLLLIYMLFLLLKHTRDGNITILTHRDTSSNTLFLSGHFSSADKL